MMKKSVSIGFLTICVAFITAGFLRAEESIKIAVIQPDRVVAGSERFRDLATKAQQDIQKKIEDLRKQEQEFSKKREKASPADMKDLAKQQKDIEIEGKALEYEYKEMQRKIQMDIMEDMDKAIKTIVERFKLDLVIPQVFFASEKVDRTQDVVDEMNKEYKKSKAASKFKKTESAKAK